MLRVDEKGSSDSSMVDINRHRQNDPDGCIFGSDSSMVDINISGESTAATRTMFRFLYGRY